MVLIITHGDQDGAYCAGYLGQIFSQAKFFIAGQGLGYGGICRKIRKTLEKDLIVIADLSIDEDLEKVIREKVEENRNIKFLIFDHHYGEPYIKISHQRVKVFWKSIDKCSNCYLLVKEWKKNNRCRSF